MWDLEMLTSKVFEAKLINNTLTNSLNSVGELNHIVPKSRKK